MTYVTITFILYIAVLVSCIFRFASAIGAVLGNHQASRTGRTRDPETAMVEGEGRRSVSCGVGGLVDQRDGSLERWRCLPSSDLRLCRSPRYGHLRILVEGEEDTIRGKGEHPSVMDVAEGLNY